MNEQRTYPQLIRRTLLPLLISGILIIATIVVSGSALIRIEDVYVNRIVAGTYGSPDWRVQEMNPLLAQLLSVLYRVLPSVNWYGVLLLALLLVASATWLHFAARTSGGLLPATVIVGPIVLLSANSMISAVVCAFTASAGAFALMSGLRRQKDGVHQTVLGALLSACAFSLSMKWGLIVSAGAMLCYLPGMARESRMRGFLRGLPTIAIIAAALFGYSSLMYSAPELSAYRTNYALYEQLQHSSLKEESSRLIGEHGIVVDSHGHQNEAAVPPEAASPDTDDEQAPQTVFDIVGWTLNDADLFFTRFGADAKLTDPDALRALLDEASTFSFDIGRLLRELFETIKKPQFLLMIALLLVAGLGLLLTRRRKGLVVLIAVLIAFGGHIFALLSYYDTYADIAPFYLLAIAALLYHFNGEDAKKWFHEKIKARLFRFVLSCGALLIFVAILAGLFYYTREHPANENQYTVQAYRFIVPYISEQEDMLFIGDNPHDRYKPDTLEAPVRGADQNLLAGAYDLYSPRAKAQMARFGIENPLVDCLNREDIGYVQMGFPDSMVFRLVEQYNIYLKFPPVELAGRPAMNQQVYLLSSYTEEELSALLEEKEREAQQIADWNAALEEIAALMEAEGLLDGGDPEAEEADGEADPTETPTPPAGDD